MTDFDELQQLRRDYYTALQTSQFKAGFLARTSHELRSPLNSLIGLHQLILSDLCDSPEEEREFIEQAHQASLKLIKLMDRIIDVAKVDYGANPLELQAVPLSKTLDRLEDLTFMQAANRGFPLTINMPEPEVYAIADPRKLLQILVGLLDTSIAYLEEGSIEVSVQPDFESEQVEIWLDLRSPFQIWSEAIDLMQKQEIPTPEALKAEKEDNQTQSGPSPGMNLWLSQSLLELMQGELRLVSATEANQPEPFTRLSCLLPLTTDANLG
ncbi:MAG: HAMP domain-containing sensor histidine kinase [Jaaginema sp. PMC 1078.18]|nr:HAMP domain-containing sensor histidine kinase [Jaaginema sp. PMC 1078.18]